MNNATEVQTLETLIAFVDDNKKTRNEFDYESGKIPVEHLAHLRDVYYNQNCADGLTYEYHLDHCFAQVIRFAFYAARGDTTPEHLVQMGYNLGRIQEIFGVNPGVINNLDRRFWWSPISDMIATKDWSQVITYFLDIAIEIGVDIRSEIVATLHTKKGRLTRLKPTKPLAALVTPTTQLNSLFRG